MPTFRAAVAGLFTVSLLLIGSSCSTPQTDGTAAPSSAAPSSAAPSSAAPSSAAPSEPEYPPASVKVTGSPKTDNKSQKEAVKVTKKFLAAFNTSFTEGELQPEILFLAPSLAEPMRAAIKKDKKLNRTHAGEVHYTLKKVTGDRTSATVGVCSDHSASVTITDGKAKQGERVSQEVKLSYTATPQRRGFAAETVSSVDADYC